MTGGYRGGFFDELISSVTYYLSYHESAGRGFMLKEYSLKYPVAEYVTGGETSTEQIQLELSHPFLFRRRIDLTLYKKQKLKYSMEFKMATSSTKGGDEKQRIFDDLVRLSYMTKYKTGEGLFLMAGKADRFNDSFRRIIDKEDKVVQKPTSITSSNDPAGFYTEWFRFDVGGEKVIDLKRPGTVFEGFCKSFEKDYKLKDGKSTPDLPKRLTTRCLAISAIVGSYTPYVAGLWKVS